MTQTQNGAAEAALRLTDWTPLDLKGKPMYAGHDEKKRMDAVRARITTVRRSWNDPAECDGLATVVQKAVNAPSFQRELRHGLDSLLMRQRYWADQDRSGRGVDNLDKDTHTNDLSALQLYTTNNGYKRIFGHINQIFRVEEVGEDDLIGAVALVELLTIDLYNLRLSNIGSAKYANFQGIVHRGLSVGPDTLEAFRKLLDKPIRERNFSVPLTFISTSASQDNIQEFLNKTEKGKVRLHWKIHIHELDPHLLLQYRSKYPDSVVTSICAMPISSISEYANEQEILLRGPAFQIIREYEEKAGEHQGNVIEMVMLNANRDHGTELAENHGIKGEQRKHFGALIRASKFEICANLCLKYDLKEAEAYRAEAEKELLELRRADFEADFDPTLSDSWSIPRATWLGAQVEDAFSPFYIARRNRFSIASNQGVWKEAEEIIDQEYEWQKGDWCNVTRLYETQAQTGSRSGYSILHQAAYNNAPLVLIQKLVDLGAWRTLKTSVKEGGKNALEIAIDKNRPSLKEILTPVIHHGIATEDLAKLEQQTHDLMQDLAGLYIDRYAVSLPQLSVMTEMREEMPSLWVPIPGIFGGFILNLCPAKPSLELLYISNVGQKQQRRYIVTQSGVEAMGPR